MTPEVGIRLETVETGYVKPFSFFRFDLANSSDLNIEEFDAMVNKITGGYGLNWAVCKYICDASGVLYVFPGVIPHDDFYFKVIRDSKLGSAGHITYSGPDKRSLEGISGSLSAQEILEPEDSNNYKFQFMAPKLEKYFKVS